MNDYIQRFTKLTTAKKVGVVVIAVGVIYVAARIAAFILPLVIVGGIAAGAYYFFRKS